MSLKPSYTENEFSYTDINPRCNNNYENVDRLNSYINVPEKSKKSNLLTVRLIVVEIYKHKKSENIIVDIRNIKSICNLDPNKLETKLSNGFPVMVISGQYYHALGHICRRYDAKVYTLTKSGIR